MTINNIKSVRTMPQETTVTFLEKPEVSFVSLVKHGANNTPFRVVKSNKGGRMNKVVQSIRVLKDSKADLKSLIGDDFREDIVAEDGNYLIYEQVDKSVCSEDTKSIVAIDPANHVYAVTYELLAEKSGESEKTANKYIDIQTSSVDVKAIDNWTVWDEMYAMTELISGSMGQSNMTTETRKSIVLSAIDNFRAFAETVFSESDSKSNIPLEKRLGEGTAKILGILQKQISTNQGGSMFELESKEELVKMISESVGVAMNAKTKSDAENTEARTKAEKAVADTEAREKEITDLKTTVKELTDNVAKIAGTVVSKTEETDSDNTGTIQKDSVYSGLFTRKAPTTVISEAA